MVSDTHKLSERMSIMKLLIISLAIAILFFGFFLPWVFRSYARTLAGKILYTQQPTTEKRINRSIAILTWSNKWITSNEEPDIQRINRLRDMLKEMQHPHG